MLARASRCWVLLERERRVAWTQQYSFTLQPRQYTDFAAMCYYHQTSPGRPSRTQADRRATPGGGVTLSDLRLITRERGQSSEQVLADTEQLRAPCTRTSGSHMWTSAVSRPNSPSS
ncbi:MAG: arylamine N-acetyltransferase [Kouleothrix sp.]